MSYRGKGKKRGLKTSSPQRFEFKTSKIIIKVSGRTTEEAFRKACKKMPPHTPQEVKGGRTERKIITHFRLQGEKAWRCFQGRRWKLLR